MAYIQYLNSVILILFFLSSNNYAMEKKVDLCPDYGGQLNTQFDNASNVFVGKVLRIDYIDPENNPSTSPGLYNYEPKIVVTLEVQNMLKGDFTDKQVILHTRFNRWSFLNSRMPISSCSGYPFEKNKTYLVFAYPHNRYSDSKAFKTLPEKALDTSIWAGTQTQDELVTQDTLKKLNKLIKL